MSQKIRIKLKSYDHNLLDNSIANAQENFHRELVHVCEQEIA